MSEGESASIIRGLETETRALSDSDRVSVSNTVMKRLKAKKENIARGALDRTFLDMILDE